MGGLLIVMSGRRAGFVLLIRVAGGGCFINQQILCEEGVVLVVCTFGDRHGCNFNILNLYIWQYYRVLRNNTKEQIKTMWFLSYKNCWGHSVRGSLLYPACRKLLLSCQVNKQQIMGVCYPLLYQLLFLILLSQMELQQHNNQQHIIREISVSETAVLNEQNKDQAHQIVTQTLPTSSSTLPVSLQLDQQSKQLIPTPQPSQENSCLSYGKNVVVLNTKFLTLFIGPDYLCFIPTFIIFLLVSYLLINYIDHSVQNVWAKIITKVVCIGECLSYLLVALSDPGIAKPIKQQNKNGKRTMFCRKCRFNVPSKTYHCSYCDVCIEGYDHHCPWTSKCIGKNNLVRFYIFLFMTPIFIVYCAFAFGFAAQANENGPNLRKSQQRYP